MKYYLGKGENSCFKIVLMFLSCVETALLSATYVNIIIHLLREFVLEKRFGGRPYNRIQKILLDKCTRKFSFT